MTKRTEAFAAMREAFRDEAEKSLALYREFSGATPSGSTEETIDILWLQSVTDGSVAYKIYLVSALWQLITRDVFLRDGHTCMACGREAEVVHHRSYDYAVMAGLDDSKLISLCNPCHRFIHFDNEQKIPPAKWEKRLQALRRHPVARRRREHRIP